VGDAGHPASQLMLTVSVTPRGHTRHCKNTRV